MAENRLHRLIACGMLMLLLVHADGYGLEERKGIIQRTTDPVCSLGCGNFYLDPDTTYSFIYLDNYNFYPYVGMHVEVVGTKTVCGGCTVLDVVSVTVLPVLGVEQDEDDIPRELQLSQNYPNPFNPQTKIMYALPRAQHVLLTIHNLVGQTVAVLVNRIIQPGSYAVVWEPGAIASGVYYCSLKTDQATLIRRMILLR